MFDFIAANPLAFIIGVVVVVLLAILIFIATRLVTVPPDEVLIVVSLGGSKTKPGQELSDPSNHTIHTSGRVFIVPVIQDAFRLSLKQRQVELAAAGPDKNFVTVQVEGNLSFKFSDRPEDVLKAAQRFRKHTDDQLSHSIQQAVEGSLRSIIASMTYQGINSDRAAFQQHVLESAKSELADQGIGVDVLNIRMITTPGSDYADNLARAELAAAKRDADIAMAKASQEAEFAKITAAEQVAQRQRDLALKQASIKGETERANAVAAAASGLARAEQDVLVAQKDRAALAERALVRQEQLDIDQKKPADAAAYSTRVRAEGEREAQKARAEAEAFTRTTEAKAQAEATETIARAEADAERVRGDARATVTEQVGQAEASATRAKATALAQYDTDALVYEVIARLPEIMSANADAVRGIGNYTVIGTQGASDAVAQATQVGTQALAAVNAVTGIDLAGLLRRNQGTPAVTDSASATGPDPAGTAPYDDADVAQVDEAPVEGSELAAAPQAEPRPAEVDASVPEKVAARPTTEDQQH